MLVLALVLMPVGWGVILASFKLFAAGVRAIPEFSTPMDPSGIKRATSRVSPKAMMHSLFTSGGVIADQRASRDARQKAWGAVGVFVGIMICLMATAVFVAGLP